jgi:hypothetical protein
MKEVIIARYDGFTLVRELKYEASNKYSSDEAMMKKTLRIWFILLTVIVSSCQFPSFESRNTPFPTLFVPTPDCGLPTLVLGTTTFQIQNLMPATDGTLTVPANTSGVGYWVEGTKTNYVFVINPMPEHAAVMSTLTVGSTAKVTWSNCNSTTYHLDAPQEGFFDASALPNQSAEGITIFFETDPSGAGFVFHGDLTEEQISTFNTPGPETTDIQAEITLLETTTSPDGESIRVGVSILNYGTATFTLAAVDVTLTQPDGTAVTMLSSEPSLPKEIASESMETIYFSFPRPAASAATLKVFTVEYELEGY